jgi:hypothetical protein
LWPRRKHLLVGNSLAYMHGRFPELGSTLTYNEVEVAHHHPSLEPPQEVVQAHQLTVDPWPRPATRMRRFSASLSHRIRSSAFSHGR